MRNFHQAISGTAMSTVNAIPASRKPRFSVVALKSPNAVPSAKVASTVHQ